MKSSMMKHGWLLAGLVLAGCQADGEAVMTAEPGLELEAAEAKKALDDAMLRGRIARMPEGLTLREVPTSSATLSRYEGGKSATKPAEPWTRPAFNPEEAGRKILEQHQDLTLADGLKLTLSLPREDYVVGEPVLLRATLENTSSRNLRLPPLLDPMFQYNQVVVTSPDGKVLGFSPIAILCSRGDLQVETLAPGEARIQDFPIFFHKDGWMFSEVGEYRIQSLYRGLTDDSERVDSNVVTLTVHPGSRADRDAAALMMGHEQGLFTMWGEGDHLEKGIEALQAVVTRYPETTAALYARYALGSNMAVDFMDGRFGIERKSVPGEVLRYLGPVVDELSRGETPALAPAMVRGAYEKVADAFVKLGRHDDARRVLADFLRTQADNPLLSVDDLNAIEAKLDRL